MSAIAGVPAGYHSLQPYLTLDGCTAAIDFYKRVFDAQERLRIKGESGLIGHCELQIGDSVIMMADQFPEMNTHAPTHFGGSPISLMIYVEDCDRVYQRALEAGAESLREPTDMPYGARMSGVRDPFGYTWWIATHIKDMSKQELERLGELSPD